MQDEKFPRRARSVILVASCALGSACGGSSSNSGAYMAQSRPEDPSCVEFWPEVRYRNYGYDHVVHLLSRCEIRAYCAVSSDVNPQPIDVLVPPREHIQVLTFRGSPASQFTPKVVCRFLV